MPKVNSKKDDIEVPINYLVEAKAAYKTRLSEAIDLSIVLKATKTTGVSFNLVLLKKWLKNFSCENISIEFGIYTQQFYDDNIKNADIETAIKMRIEKNIDRLTVFIVATEEIDTIVVYDLGTLAP